MTSETDIVLPIQMIESPESTDFLDCPVRNSDMANWVLNDSGPPRLPSGDMYVEPYFLIDGSRALESHDYSTQEVSIADVPCVTKSGEGRPTTSAEASCMFEAESSAPRKPSGERNREACKRFRSKIRQKRENLVRQVLQLSAENQRLRSLIALLETAVCSNMKLPPTCEVDPEVMSNLYRLQAFRTSRQRAEDMK